MLERRSATYYSWPDVVNVDEVSRCKYKGFGSVRLKEQNIEWNNGKLGSIILVKDDTNCSDNGSHDRKGMMLREASYVQDGLYDLT